MRHLLPRFLSTLWLLTAVVAQDGIRIVTVPERLQLPAASGANLLLEVEVDGTAEAVWLSTDAAAVDRVPLAAAGANRFQRNLADAAVADLLPAGRDRGSLFVFARRDGRVGQSAAIEWTRATAVEGTLRCVVRSRGRATRTVAADTPCWLDVAALQRIELQGATARQATSVARFGELELPLVRQRDDGLWLLDADERTRERMHAARTFEIEARQGAASTLFAFRCIPAALRLDPARATFTVPQRKRAWLPGSDDWLQVHLDDITGGRVRLEIVTAEGNTVVEPRFVQERDHVEFSLGKGTYVLAVKRLANSLVGEDHAEFTIDGKENVAPDRIAQLMRAVEQSGDTFLREGREYTGSMAAQFLLGKVRAHGGEPTVDEFVQNLASRSTRSGEAYQVRKKDGTVVPMRAWLEAELQKLEATPAAGEKPR